MLRTLRCIAISTASRVIDMCPSLLRCKTEILLPNSGCCKIKELKDSASKWVTGPWFTLPPGITKKMDNVWNSGFQVTEHQVMKGSPSWGEMGNEWGEPSYCLNLPPWVSVQEIVEEKQNPSWAGQTPWVREMELGIWEDHGGWNSQVRLPGRREQHRAKTPGIFRAFPLGVQLRALGPALVLTQGWE